MVKYKKIKSKTGLTSKLRNKRIILYYKQKINKANISKIKKDKIKFEVHGIPFIINKRYSYLNTLGKGSFGFVISAKDNKTNNTVAIKRISSVFDNFLDSKRTLREIKLLSLFKRGY